MSLPTAGALLSGVAAPLACADEELWLVRDDVIGLLEWGWSTEPVFRPLARWPHLD